MRADERQAAVAYAYAWWMTGDDEAAGTALREALAAPAPVGGEDVPVALARGVRRHLGDLRAMPPASEVALLHDGFGLPLEAAAQLASVPAERAASELAHGRLEALLETVREEFRHPERLGGIAVGAADDLAHAQDCRSCGKARVLIERGRTELQQVSSVSAPPGLLARLVAEAAPADAEAPEAEAAEVAEAGGPEAEEAEATAPADAEASAEGETAAPGAVAVHDILGGPGDYAVAGDDVLDRREPTPPEAPDEIVLDDADVEITIVDDGPAAPADTGAPPLPEAPADDTVTVPEAPPAPPVEEPGEPAEPARDLVPAPPGRRRTAGLLAGAGIVTASVLIAVLVASGGSDDPDAPPDDDPAVDRTEAPTEPAGNGGVQPTDDPFGPAAGERRGFAVTTAGLLLSGEDEVAPSGTVVGRREPLRIAVAYEKANRGVELRALWRIGDRVFQRLETLVTARDSRHVWAVPVPENGWPPGAHRIVITADDNVAGAIDFTVRKRD